MTPDLTIAVMQRQREIISQALGIYCQQCFTLPPGADPVILAATEVAIAKAFNGVQDLIDNPPRPKLRLVINGATP
jgi:hypothetical protein